MKTLIVSLGVLIFLTGGVWFLQGINILPGSYMTGQLEWAVYGGTAMVVGVALAYWGIRRS